MKKNNGIQAKNNKQQRIIKTLIIPIAIIAVVSLVVGLSWNALSNEYKQTQTVKLVINSFTNQTYRNGSGSVKATISIGNRIVEDEHDFTYSSSNEELLRFIDAKKGIYSVEDVPAAVPRDKNGNIDEEGEIKVTITVRSAKYNVSASEQVSIRVAPEYEITIDSIEDGLCQDKIGVWNYKVGANKGIDGTVDMPKPNLNELDGFSGWGFDGWYQVFDDGTVSDLRFSPEDKYYYDQNITLKARYKTTLELNADTLSDNDSVSDVYYKETLTDGQIEKLEKGVTNNNGWNFEGWFEGVGGANPDHENGLYDGVFAAKVNRLYAKWTATPTIDTVFDTKNNVANSLKVVYNAEVDGLEDTVAYSNEGEFIGWYVTDNQGRDIKISNGQKYQTSTNNKIKAKVKFPVEFNYQGATPKSGETNKQYYIVYGESFASANIEMPRPNTLNEDGWKFEGWNTAYNASGDTWNAKTIYNWDLTNKESGALVLYANRTTSIYLHNQLDENGKPVSSVKYTRKIHYNEKLEIPESGEAAGEDWTFAGYYNVEGGIFDANGNEDKKVLTVAHYQGLGEQYLYAKWTGTVSWTTTCSPIDEGNLDVVYNGKLSGLKDIASDYYYHNGEFVNWQIGNSEVKNGSRFIYDTKEPIVARVQYPLILNYQGATPKDNEVNKEYRIVYGESLSSNNISLPAPEFSKENGWNFEYWYTADKNEWTANSVYEQEGSLELYAKRTTEIKLYNQLTYKGEEKQDVVTYTRRLEYNGVLDIPVDETAGNWRFDGYYNVLNGQFSAEGNDIRIETTQNYKGAGELELYAKWIGLMNFNVDNGLGTPVSEDGEDIFFIPIVYNGVIPALPTVRYNAQQSGDAANIFEGWFTEQYGDGDRVATGNLYKGNENVDLYDKTKIKIFLNDTLNNTTYEKDIVYGKNISGIDRLTDEESGVWLHIGWGVAGIGDVISDSDGTFISKIQNIEYKFETNDRFNGSITLTSIWSLNTLYEVNIGDIVAEGKFLPTTVLYSDDKLILPDIPQQVSWRVAGWFANSTSKDELLNGTILFDTLKELLEDKNNIISVGGESYFKLTAQWRTTVNLNYAGGVINSDEQPNQMELIYGETTKLPQNVTAPNGYETADKKWVNSEGTEITSNMLNYPLKMGTLTHEWKGKKYNITFKYWSTSEEGYVKLEQVPVTMGQRDKVDFTTPIINEKAYPSGYYYYQPGETIGRLDQGTRYFDREGAAVTDWNIPADVVLYAAYGSTFSITLDLQKGSGTTSVYGVVSGQNLPSGIDAPTKTGYTFEGFYSSTDYKIDEQYYDSNMNGCKIWTSSSGTELYAKWKAIELGEITTSKNNKDDLKEIGSSEAMYINISGGSGSYIYSAKITSGDTDGATLSFATATSSTSPTDVTQNKLTVEKRKGSKSGTITVTVTDYYTGLSKTKDLPYSTSSCFASGTLITLADGSRTAIENISSGDIVMSWNFLTGKLEPMKVSIYWDHGQDEYDIVNLKFSNGEMLRIIGDHGVFDLTTNRFEYINADNYTDYIGHSFASVSNTSSAVELVDAYVTKEITGCYSLETEKNGNAIASGMLTLTPQVFVELFMYAEVGDNLTFDSEKLNADIEQYGLYSYDEWKEYVTLEQFNAFNGQYMKIIVGKGIITEEQLIEMISQWL